MFSDALEAAVRSGEVRDDPEGARFITISDTLAREIAGRCLHIARKLDRERRVLAESRSI
jgi:hypothetical protein